MQILEKLSNIKFKDRKHPCQKSISDNKHLLLLVRAFIKIVEDLPDLQLYCVTVHR